MLPSGIQLNASALSPMTQLPVAICVLWDASGNASCDPDNIPSAVLANGMIRIGPNANDPVLGPYQGWFDAATYFSDLNQGILPPVFTKTVTPP